MATSLGVIADLSNTIDDTPPWLLRKAALDFLKLPIAHVASDYDDPKLDFKIVTHGGAYDFATRGCRVDCFSAEANSATSKTSASSFSYQCEGVSV